MGIKVLASGSSGNCYLLETSKETLILECGIKYKDILKGLGFDLSKVVGCLISHEHKDHCKAVNDLLANGVWIYSSKGTINALNLKSGKHSYKVSEICNSNIRFIHNFTITPFSTQHDVAEPLGFIIYHKELGSVLFATDTYYLKYRFEKIDHILIECNYSESILNTLPAWRARVLKSHMSLETLKEALKTWDLSRTKDITLIHISEGNGEPERFRKEIEELTGIKTYVAAQELIIK